MRSLIVFLFIFTFLNSSHGQEAPTATEETQAPITSIPVFETTITTAPLNSSYRKVISKEEIVKSGAKNMVQLLREKAGITVTNSAFAPNAIYIRGGDAGHILYLIDGFAIYDAISDKRTFNLNSVNLASIKKIEVIKGSQTALYGGQALAGVIKIETINFEPSDKKLKAAAVGGDHKLAQIYLNSENKQDLNDVRQVSAYYQQRTNDSPLRYSKYEYPEKSYSGEAARLSKYESGTLVLKARFFDEEKNIVNRTQDAIDFEAGNNHYLVAARWIGLETKKWPTVNVSYVESRREYYHPINVLNPSIYNQTFDGSVVSARVEQPFVTTDSFKSIVGLSWAQEKGKIINTHGQNPALDGLRDSFTQNLYGVFATGTYTVRPEWMIDAGVRWEKLPTKEGSSFQVGTSYDLYRMEYAESIKAPTLFNLYDFQYGYPDLKPEYVRTLTAERSFIVNEDMNFNLAVFYSKYDDLIEATSTPSGVKYQNVAESEITGVEGSAYLKLTSFLALDLNATYQHPEDKVRDRRLIRRPYKTYSAQLTEAWTDRFSTYQSYYHSGDRLDFGASTTTIITLPPHDQVGLGAQYKQNDKLNWNLKIQNLLDKRYAESYSYYSEGFSATATVEYEN